MAWLAGYTKRKKITIDNTNVDSDLTDFPLLVNVTSDAAIGAVCRSDGYDIRFTSSDGTTLLKYEREAFSVASSQATGIWWVKVPTVAGASDTDVYLYYGKADATDGADAENVWDSSHSLVWHLPNGTSLTATDSTANNNDGTVTNATAASGLVNGVAAFDGSGDYIYKDSAAGFDFGTGDFSVSLWFKTAQSATVDQRQCGKYAEAEGSPQHYWGFYNTGSKLRFYASSSGVNNYIESSTNIWNNEYHHLAGVRSGTTLYLYIDGSSVSNACTANDLTWTARFSVGRWGNYAGDEVNGQIDEVRVSAAARSAAWLKFEYNNIIAADNELTIAAEEVLATDAVAFPRPWMAPLLYERDEWWATRSYAVAGGNRRRRLLFTGGVR